MELIVAHFIKTFQTNESIYTKMFTFYSAYKFPGAFSSEKVKYSLKKDRERLIIRNNILWKILFM